MHHCVLKGGSDQMFVIGVMVISASKIHSYKIHFNEQYNFSLYISDKNVFTNYIYIMIVASAVLFFSLTHKKRIKT